MPAPSVDQLIAKYQQPAGYRSTDAAHAIRGRTGQGDLERVARGYKGVSVQQAANDREVQFALLRDEISDVVAKYDDMFARWGDLLKSNPGFVTSARLMIYNALGATKQARALRAKVIVEKKASIQAIVESMITSVEDVGQKIEQRLQYERELKQEVRQYMGFLKDEYLAALRADISGDVDATVLQDKIAEHEAEITTMDQAIADLETKIEAARAGKDIKTVTETAAQLETLYRTKRTIVDTFDLTQETSKEARRRELGNINRIGAIKDMYQQSTLQLQTIENLIDNDAKMGHYYKNLREIVLPGFRLAGKVATAAEEGLEAEQLARDVAFIYQRVVAASLKASQSQERATLELFREHLYDEEAAARLLEEARQSKREIMQLEEDIIEAERQRARHTAGGTDRLRVAPL